MAITKQIKSDSKRIKKIMFGNWFEWPIAIIFLGIVLLIANFISQDAQKADDDISTKKINIYFPDGKGSTATEQVKLIVSKNKQENQALLEMATDLWKSIAAGPYNLSYQPILPVKAMDFYSLRIQNKTLFIDLSFDILLWMEMQTVNPIILIKNIHKTYAQAIPELNPSITSIECGWKNLEQLNITPHLTANCS